MTPEIKKELLSLLATASQETWNFLAMVANRAEIGSRKISRHSECVAFRMFVHNHRAPHNRLPPNEKVDSDFDAHMEKLREPVAEVVQQVDDHLDELNASKIIAEMATNIKPFCALPISHKRLVNETLIDEPHRVWSLTPGGRWVQRKCSSPYGYGELSTVRIDYEPHPEYVDVEVRCDEHGFYEFFMDVVPDFPGNPLNWWSLESAQAHKDFMGYVVNGELLETLPIPVPTDDKGKPLMKLKFRKDGD